MIPIRRYLRPLQRAILAAIKEVYSVKTFREAVPEFKCLRVDNCSELTLRFGESRRNRVRESRRTYRESRRDHRESRRSHRKSSLDSRLDSRFMQGWRIERL